MTKTPASLSAPAVWLVLLAAGGTFALTMGARQSMGLFLGDLNSSTGLGLAQISLAFAFGQLWWGLTQPFAGLVADRYGPGRVLILGVLLVCTGTALIPLMHSSTGLILAIGVLAAGGAGMAGPSVLMAATTRLVPAERRGMATGIVNAGGSFGQFVFAPIAQGMTAAAGWVSALQLLAVLPLMALPAAWVLRKQPTAAGAPAAAPVEPTGQVLRRALRDRSFLLLSGGFMVCGFHVAFLATHLPGVVVSCGLPAAVGAWSLAVIGLFNIVGSFGIGWAIGFQGGRWRMKSLLSLIYLLRGVAVLVFVLSPKSSAGMLVFAAVMGVSFLSTVPPTAGLVARFFGPAHMGTLFGMVMLAHQIGGFLGAYLGGKTFEATGNYTWMFYADAVLAFGAALMHLPIRESSRVVVPAAQPA
ncbi:MFS transporter [Ideonella azotifigens]|uniref:MFS transporter n=2 Tax=Ideonella azotifigens TaxID=513160 RepID=A0ABN1KEW2_9BURK|nr:MFS transporter [Ideonella azotifigens]MCD2340746.1 MFS transporter [Ideonella azotifigens]